MDDRGLRESEPGRQPGEEEACTVTELLLQLRSCHGFTLRDEVPEHRTAHALGTLETTTKTVWTMAHVTRPFYLVPSLEHLPYIVEGRRGGH